MRTLTSFPIRQSGNKYFPPRLQPRTPIAMSFLPKLLSMLNIPRPAANNPKACKTHSNLLEYLTTNYRYKHIVLTTSSFAGNNSEEPHPTASESTIEAATYTHSGNVRTCTTCHADFSSSVLDLATSLLLPDRSWQARTDIRLNNIQA